MTKEELYNKAILIVGESTGIKLVELSVALTERFHEHFESDEIVETISKLSDSEDVVAVKYTIPTLEYREKCILFPKGTKILT